MKALTTTEKVALIRDHGDALARTGRTAYGLESRAALIAHAQRVIELVKSIPKVELEP